MVFLRNQSGAAAVAVALMLTVMLGFGALVIDVGYMFHEKQRLQMAADASALAAAVDPALAQSSASRMASANGQSTGLSVIKGNYNLGLKTFSPGAVPTNAVKTHLTSTQSAFLAGILGVQQLPVTASAVALFQLAPPNLLSGKDTRFNGAWDIRINGKGVRFHANGDVIVNGNPTVTPADLLTVSAVGTVNQPQLGSGGARPIPIPPVDWAALQAAGTVYNPPTGTMTIDVGSLPANNGTIFVNGNVVLTGSAASLSNLTIVATGTISVGADLNGTLNSDSGVSLFLAAKGQITVEGTVSKLTNVLMRTEGDFRSNGGGNKAFTDLYIIAEGEIRNNGKVPDFSFSGASNITGSPFALPGARSRLVM